MAQAIAASHLYQEAVVPPSGFVPQVAVPMPSTRNITRTKLQKNKVILKQLGISEITLGCLCCAVAIAEMIFLAQEYSLLFALWASSQGLWCGVILVISGILGVRAKMRPSRLVYGCNVAFSIIAAIFMIILTVSSVRAAATQFSTAINIVLSAIGSCAFFITYVHFAYSCAGCSHRNRRGSDYTVTNIPQHQYMRQTEQIVQLPRGEPMFVPFQPTVIQGCTAGPVPVSSAEHQPALALPQQQVNPPSTSIGIQPFQPKPIQGYPTDPVPVFACRAAHQPAPALPQQQLNPPSTSIGFQPSQPKLIQGFPTGSVPVSASSAACQPAPALPQQQVDPWSTSTDIQPSQHVMIQGYPTDPVSVSASSAAYQQPSPIPPQQQASPPSTSTGIHPPEAVVEEQEPLIQESIENSSECIWITTTV